MKDGLDSAALCVVGEAVQVFADARPAAVIELEFAVCKAFVEQNDVVGVQLCQQVTQGGGSVAHLVPAVRSVEVARKRAAGDAELALAQLVLQLFWIGRKVAERAELDGVVVGLGDFVEEAVPGRLAFVGWGPHSPRVGGGTY